jgi:hypothetical protein
MLILCIIWRALQLATWLETSHFLGLVYLMSDLLNLQFRHGNIYGFLKLFTILVFCFVASWLCTHLGYFFPGVINTPGLPTPVAVMSVPQMTKGTKSVLLQVWCPQSLHSVDWYQASSWPLNPDQLRLGIGLSFLVPTVKIFCLEQFYMWFCSFRGSSNKERVTQIGIQEISGSAPSEAA